MFRFILFFLLCLGITLTLTALDYWYNDLWIVIGSTLIGLIGLYSHKWILILFRKITPFSISGQTVKNGVKLYKQKAKLANAFASGFGNTKMTRFTTRLLELCTDDEINAVLLHEEGHHDYNDSLWGTLLMFLIGNGIALISTNVTSTLFYSIIIATVLALPGLLVYLAYYRWKETRADQYAFARLDRPAHLGEAIEKMVEDTEKQRGYKLPRTDNTFSSKYLATHPSLSIRKK